MFRASEKLAASVRMNFKYCLLLLSLLLAGMNASPTREPPTRPMLPPCTPWCAGQPTPPPGAIN
ncbi:uncharacterized protein LOC111598999 [Drosophila hydei]|uniref:Uncharacterized protein LOC111598999 n=1 Tax=Drosophila hydei TaxID=7224 RepID=A0A6J1LTA6_DROHY|nr:uncharacterized protein LOC111598999 [Drosophila hydei]